MNINEKSTHTLCERIVIFFYRPTIETFKAIFTERYVTISLEARNEILNGKTTAQAANVPISKRDVSSKDDIETILSTSQTSNHSQQGALHSDENTNPGSPGNDDSIDLSYDYKETAEHRSVPPFVDHSTPPPVDSNMDNDKIKKEEELPQIKIVVSEADGNHMLDPSQHVYGNVLREAMKDNSCIYYYKFDESEKKFIITQANKKWANEQISLVYRIIINTESNEILTENQKLANDQQNMQTDNVFFKDNLERNNNISSEEINTVFDNAKAAVSDSCGKRQRMEDAYILRKKCGDHYMCGVYDGHGGKNISTYISTELPKIIEKQLQYWGRQTTYTDKTTGKETIMNKKTCNCNALIMAHVLLDEKDQRSPGGSTSVSANLIDDDLYISNLGDSRAILISPDGTVTQLTEDAKPLTEINERNEIYKENRHTHDILKRGGCVTYLENTTRKDPLTHDNRPLRVNKCLLVAKAIGDKLLMQEQRNVEQKEKLDNIKTTCTQAISARPDITVVNKPKDGWNGYKLLLCCDGLTDVASTNQIGNYVHKAVNEGLSYDYISAHLVASAINAGSLDNVTILLCDVNNMESQN